MPLPLAVLPVSFKLDHFYPHRPGLDRISFTLIISLPSGMPQCVGVAKIERKWIPSAHYPSFPLFFMDPTQPIPAKYINGLETD